MTLATLPISRLIRGSISLSARAARAQNLSTLLILGTSTVIDVVSRMREYDSLDAVASDFGTSAPEYFAALDYFAQDPSPDTLLIGRWAKTASHGQLFCAPLSAAEQAMANFNAIDAGVFNVSVDSTPQVITGLNFTAAANLNAVAALINAHLSGASVVWDALSGTFVFTSSSTGPTSKVSFLTAPGSGDNVAALLQGLSTSSGAYLADGIAAESAVTAVAQFDAQFGQQWYPIQVLGLTPGANAGADTAALLAVSAYIEGANTEHLHVITTQEAGVLVPATTTDIAYQVAQLEYERTLTQYSSGDPYAVASAIARAIVVDYDGSNTAITMAYKQSPGVVSENLTPTQANSCIAKRCLVLTSYNNGTSFFEPASTVMGDGTFIDDRINADWALAAARTALFNVLYTIGTKVAQTDQGVHLLVVALQQVGSQAVKNGVAAPGTWNSAGFGALVKGQLVAAGFYVYAPPVAEQDQSDREDRDSPLLQMAIKFAGAIHQVDFAITVNR